MSASNDIQKIELSEKDFVCANCKYYGCDRSKNCDTICDKWSLSEFVLEEMLETLESLHNLVM